MKVRITTDSTADIPKEFCERLNIRVIPLTVIAEGKEYADGVDITPEEFYPILDSAKTMPVSSQVTIPAYMELFEDTLSEGYADLIHVSINAKGSGTFQAGVIAKEMFEEKHPDCGLNITMIDSRTYSMTYGIPVIKAAEMVAEGASAEEVIDFLNEWLPHARPLLMALDLKCVKKSGRISAVAGFVGDALGLKPVITFEDGESKVLSKARGDDKAFAALIERCLKERKPGTSYALVHGSNLDTYAQFRQMCLDAFDIPPMAEYPVGCVIAINTGPNMVGILYRT